MKLLKRILLLIALVLSLVAAGGYWLFQATPGFYQDWQWDPQQREQVARRAESKITEVHNALARAHVAQSSGATRPAGKLPVTVTFRQDELNAFLRKWSEPVRGQYERYATDPGVFFSNGRIILAARVKGIGALVSVHFVPYLDDEGQLHLRMVRQAAGRLPLPQSILAGRLEDAGKTLEGQLPKWQRGAAIGDGGSANLAAVSAVLGKLLLNTLRGQPSAPVVFLPGNNQDAIPVKLTQVQVQDGSLTVTVQPLSPGETQVLRREIQQASAASAR